MNMKYAVKAITNLRGITDAETSAYIWNYSKVNQIACNENLNSCNEYLARCVQSVVVIGFGKIIFSEENV